MNIVLFQREEMDKPLPLKDERAKHIIKVLHKQTGDTFEAGIINGKAGQAEITAITDEGISFHFLPLTGGKPLYPITLIIGFPRPIQLKRLFRDAAGLGASRLCLCGTELGEKSYMDSNIVERGAAYAALLDGTAQAKSTHVPELSLFPSVKACLSALFPDTNVSGSSAAPFAQNDAQIPPNEKINDIRVMLDNVKPESSLFSYMKQCTAEDPNIIENNDTSKTATISNKNAPALTSDKERMVYAAIGSERGWTDRERALFAENGFASCSMGYRVLRTETAATVAMSLILQSLGIL
jgi:RsmE family RNA methyltransferase